MLDIRKMERPHRSGVLAIAVAYSLLYIAVDFTNLGNLGDGTWKDLVLCHLVPVVCIDLSAQRPEPPPQQYEVTRLTYCPKCKVKEKQDAACIEIDIDNQTKTMDVHCESWEDFHIWYFQNLTKRANWSVRVYTLFNSGGESYFAPSKLP